MTTKKQGIGVGIDVGGTFTKVVAVSHGRRSLREIEMATQPGRGPREFVRRVIAAVGQMKSSLGRPINGAGLGIAGDVDSEQGNLRFSPNLRSFAGFKFKHALRAGLKAPVVVYNDARMAAWGGYLLELKRRPKNMICVTMGTGIGGGLVLNGKLYLGTNGTAGEIGHIIVEPDGELCHCGSRGCLEAYAGSYGIVRSARKMLDGPKGKKSILRRLCPDLNLLEPRILEVAARRGDPVARSVWQMTGYYLGIGLSNLVCTLNPDVILIVGGVSKAGNLVLNPIRKIFKSRPFRTPFGHVRVRVAKKPHLGAMGAALAGLEADEI